jgi:hypothetical protein
MIKRLTHLTAFGAGYVLGARAGRERYEQIRALALRVKDDPRVQEKAHEAAEAVKAETSTLKDRVSDKLHGEDLDIGPSTGPTFDDGNFKTQGDPLGSSAR